MSNQSLLEQLLLLYGNYHIALTHEQVEGLSRCIDRYMVCCRCYSWDASLRSLLLFYRQIEDGVRLGVIDTPMEYKAKNTCLQP